MINAEENYAHKLRGVGERNAKAEESVATAEADVKMVIAQSKVTASMQGHKSNAAQENLADEQQDVFDARLRVGVAKGELAAARTEVLACRMEFDQWRTKMATLRKEQEIYRA